MGVKSHYICSPQDYTGRPTGEQGCWGLSFLPAQAVPIVWLTSSVTVASVVSVLLSTFISGPQIVSFCSNDNRFPFGLLRGVSAEVASRKWPSGRAVSIFSSSVLGVIWVMVIQMCYINEQCIP